MKFQIDTKEKMVLVLEDANIKELVKALKGMLGEEYENYSIKSDSVVYTHYYPWYDWTWNDHQITCSTGVYNVEVTN
jgi:hypothetical protein